MGTAHVRVDGKLTDFGFGQIAFDRFFRYNYFFHYIVSDDKAFLVSFFDNIGRSHVPNQERRCRIVEFVVLHCQLRFLVGITISATV